MDESDMSPELRQLFEVSDLYGGLFVCDVCGADPPCFDGDDRERFTEAAYLRIAELGHAAGWRVTRDGEAACAACTQKAATRQRRR